MEIINPNPFLDSISDVIIDNVINNKKCKHKGKKKTSKHKKKKNKHKKNKSHKTYMIKKHVKKSKKNGKDKKISKFSLNINSSDIRNLIMSTIEIIRCL